MAGKNKKQLRLWRDYIKVIADREKTNVCKLLLWRLLETVSLTIPAFIFVILFPIKEENFYDWYSGIWHGWFALCNMILSLISPDILYKAPNGTSNYYICWWIAFILGTGSLLGLYFLNILSLRERNVHDFVPPLPESDQNSNNHEIRVFISSTFHDMQKERDYLMTHTFPKIQEEARLRNVNIVPIDLRWGITEEESKSGKVIELCLQEIDRAIPFFIGIIGKRYGWQPSVDEFYKRSLLKERHPWIEEDLKNGLSVTEIEMQYGVLRRKELINAVFFTTSGTLDLSTYYDKEEEARLAKLKLSIIKDGRYPIITVLSPENFGNEVFDLFLSYLDQYFPINSQPLGEGEEMNFSSDFNKKEYITKYFNKAGKKLSEQQLNSIVNHPLSDNSMVLNALIKELLVFGDFDKLNGYIEYWLEAKTPMEFYIKVLEQAELKYGKRQVRAFFSILAVSEKSIVAKDLLEMAEIAYEDMLSGNDFSIYGEKSLGRQLLKCFNLKNMRRKPFDLYFSDYLQKDKDNKVFLSHDYMKHAIETKYLSNEKTIKKYKKMLREYRKDGFMPVSNIDNCDADELEVKYNNIKNSIKKLFTRSIAS